MDRWERFLNSLDTPGGHIVILLSLLTITMLAAIAFKWSKGDTLAAGIFDVLLYAMRGNGKKE